MWCPRSVEGLLKSLQILNMLKLLVLIILEHTKKLGVQILGRTQSLFVLC